MHKKTFTKTIAWVVTFALALAIFPAVPFPAQASTASQLVTQINNFAHGGSGSLTATRNGDVVTVTGTVTGVQNQLFINIDAGVKVVWQADYTYTDMYGLALGLYGQGEFEIVSGQISCPNGVALACLEGSVTLTISGGTISNSSESIYNTPSVLRLQSNATCTMTGGTVTSTGTSNSTISLAANASFTMTGGTVSAVHEDTSAIYLSGNSAFTITGGTVAFFNNNLITELGVIIVSDDATAVVLGGTFNGGGNVANIFYISRNSNTAAVAYNPDAVSGSVINYRINSFSGIIVQITATQVAQNQIGIANPGGMTVAEQIGGFSARWVNNGNLADIDIYQDGSQVNTIRTRLPIIGLSPIIVEPQTINIAAPVAGATPQNTLQPGANYTGSISWNPTDNPFAGGTVYTATVTLTSTNGYMWPVAPAANAVSVPGQTVDNLTVSGNAAGNTLQFQVTFPQTAAFLPTTRSIYIAAPVTDSLLTTPAISGTGFNGSHTWRTVSSDSPYNGNAVGGVQYKAMVTLTSTGNNTWNPAESYNIEVAGSQSVTNYEVSGTGTGNKLTFEVVFPPTTRVISTNQTINIAAPLGGQMPQTTISPQTTYTGSITWSVTGGAAHSNSTAFAQTTAYTAHITLTAATGYYWQTPPPTVSVHDATVVNPVVSGNTLTFDANFPTSPTGTGVFVTGDTTGTTTGPFTDVSSLQTAITSALANAGASTNTVVIVTGSLHDVTDPLTINLNSRRVVWQADYSGSPSSDSLISIDGNGTFEIVDGGKINETGSSTAISPALRISSTSSPTILVNGGEVICNKDNAAIGITNGSPIVRVVSGSVRNTSTTGTNSTAIYIGNINSSTSRPAVIVEGGTVSTSSGSTVAYAISAYSQNTIQHTIAITGGTVQNTGNAANVVQIARNGTLFYSGGTVADGSLSKVTETGTYIGLYLGEGNIIKFNRSASRFTATNLFALEDAYTLSTQAAQTDDVIVTLPSTLTVTEITSNTSVGTASNTARTYTFDDVIERNDVTLTVQATLAGGVVPLHYTTTPFEVNIVPFAINATLTGAFTNFSALNVGYTLSGTVTFTLSGGSFASVINPADFYVSGLPNGIVAGTAERASDTTVTVAISGAATEVSSASTPIYLPSSIPAVNVTYASGAIPISGNLSIVPIGKGSGAAVSVPVVSTTDPPTRNTITVEPVTLLTQTGQSIIYAISTVSGLTSYADTISLPWQEGTTFTNLEHDTTYFVYARSSDNDNYNQGNVAESAAIQTLSTSIYTITYNLNSGTQQAGSWNSYTFGVGLTLPTTPTKTGYTFDGWYADEDFTGTPVTSISETDTGNKTFWAKWMANTYTITFNYDDATGGNTTTEATTGTDGKLASLPTPTKTGYTFKGWFTTATSSTEVTTGTVFTANATIYAQWEEETDLCEIEHTPGAAATCITPQKCTECQTVLNPALDHDYQNYVSDDNATCTADGTETATCIRCDETNSRMRIDSMLPHTPKVANCTECENCTTVLERTCSTQNPCTFHTPDPDPDNGGGGSNNPINSGRRPTSTTNTTTTTSEENESVTGTEEIIVDIPVTAIREIAGNLPTTQIAATSAGTQLITTERANAGQNAVLLVFNNETGEFEVVSAATVNADGTATVNIPGAGDYIVVVAQTGDLTGTGNVTAADALLLLQALAGNAELNPLQKFLTSSRSDSKYTATDALNILKFVAGMIDEL